MRRQRSQARSRKKEREKEKMTKDEMKDLVSTINEAFSKPNMGLTDKEVDDLLSVDIFSRILQKKREGNQNV